MEKWRSRMIEQLKGRPEGFTDGKKLFAGKKHIAPLPFVEKYKLPNRESQ